MPSSKKYVRDMTQEYETAKRRGDLPKIAARNKNRRALQKGGVVKPFDGKDINHKVPLSKGGSNKRCNLEVIPASKNRSFKRKPNGSMK